MKKKIELPESGKTETAIRLNTAIAWEKLLLEISTGEILIHPPWCLQRSLSQHLWRVQTH